MAHATSRRWFTSWPYEGPERQPYSKGDSYAFPSSSLPDRPPPAALACPAASAPQPSAESLPAPALADTFPSTLLVATSGGVNQYRYNPTTGQTTPLCAPVGAIGGAGEGQDHLPPLPAVRLPGARGQVLDCAICSGERRQADSPCDDAGHESDGRARGASLWHAPLCSGFCLCAGGRAVVASQRDWDVPDPCQWEARDPTWIRVPGAGVSALAVDQTGRYLFAANTWTNEVIRYRIDRTTGVPFEPKTLSTESLHWPVALAVSANNTHLYVANRAASQGRFTVTQCRINSQGELALLTPAEVPVAGGSPVMVAVDREGRFASVVSAEFHVGEPGTVSRFRIGRDGGLTPFQTVSAGRGANAIAVAAGFAFVANSRARTCRAT